MDFFPNNENLNYRKRYLNMKEIDRVENFETENGGMDRESQLAKLLDQDDVVCAHVYDDDGYSEFLFLGSPENIANFIGAHPLAHQIVLTDREENPFLWTIGYFIDRCPDKVLLEEVKKWLIPIQMSEVEAQPVFSPSIGEAVGYMMRQQMPGDEEGADCDS